MAAEKAAEKNGLKFALVTVEKAVGSTKGDPAGGTVHPETGRLELNMQGSRSFGQVSHSAGVDPRKAAVRFGVIVARKLVAAYPVEATAADTVGIRWLSRGNLALYLESVIEQHPDLKVDTKRQIAVSAEIDEDGKHCLVIALQSSLIKRKGSKKDPVQGQAQTTGRSRRNRQQSASGVQAGQAPPAATGTGG